MKFAVEIRYRGRRFSTAHAQNMSREGIYVQTCRLALPRGTMLELEFRRWGREWQTPAIVVHGDSRGFGLMFHETQSELYDYETGALVEPSARLSAPERASC